MDMKEALCEMYEGLGYRTWKESMCGASDNKVSVREIFAQVTGQMHGNPDGSYSGVSIRRTGLS